MPTRHVHAPDHATTPESLARAIIARQPQVSTVRLLKLAFLAETRYIEQFGSRLSDADWFNWKHGPYSKRIVNGVRGLPEDVVHHKERLVSDRRANYYTSGRNCAPELSSQVANFLDNLIRVYGGEDTQAIVSAVYRLTPFRRSQSGRPIDLDAWAHAVAQIKNSSDVQRRVLAALRDESVHFSSASELLEFLNEARLSGGGN